MQGYQTGCSRDSGYMKELDKCTGEAKMIHTFTETGRIQV
jgi:hypothetical protein